MNPTTKDLNIKKFDIRAISFEKGKQRGIEVIEGAQKNSIFNDEMEIIAQKSELQSNDTLLTKNGQVIVFPKESFNTLKNNIKNRNTIGLERKIDR